MPLPLTQADSKGLAAPRIVREGVVARLVEGMQSCTKLVLSLLMIISNRSIH